MHDVKVGFRTVVMNKAIGKTFFHTVAITTGCYHPHDFITRPLGHEILPGITRAALMDCANKLSLTIEERPFTIEEAKVADEAFVTAASIFVMPVVKIDDATIGNGKPGKTTKKLRELYIEHAALNGV